MVSRQYLSTQEAADTLGYSRQHIRVLIRSGHLRAERVGRNWLILAEAVQEYLTQRRNLPLFGNARRGRPSRGERSGEGKRE